MSNAKMLIIMIRGILNSLSNWEFQKGQLQIFQQVLEMRQQGDRPSETEALISMADSYNRLGKYTQAQELIEQTLAIVQQASLQQQQRLQSIEAEALKLLGIVYFGQGNFAKAQETAQTALAMHKQLGDRIGEGATLIVVSAALIHLGQHFEAKKALEESLKALRETSSSLDELKWRRFYEGEALAWMGDIEIISGNLEQAARTLEQALAVNRETGNRSYGELNTLYFIAALYSNQGELDKTLESCQQLLNLSQEIGHRFYEGITLISIGGVYQAQKQDDRALASYQQALEVFQEIGDRQKQAETIVAIADIYIKQEQSQQISLEHYEQALAIARDINNRPTEAKCFYSIGVINTTLRQHTQAIAAYQKALAIYTDAEIQKLLDKESQPFITQRIYTSIYHSFAQLYLLQGRYLEAQEYLNKSLELWQSLLAEAKVNGDCVMEKSVLKELLTVHIILISNYDALQQHNQAINYVQKALVLAKLLGDREQEKQLTETFLTQIIKQSLAYETQKNYEEAWAICQQALKTAKENRLQQWEAKMLLRIGGIYVTRQDFSQALSYQEQALAIAEQLGDRSTQIFVLQRQGIVYQYLSNYSESLKAYQQAYDLAQTEWDQLGLASLLLTIGTIHADQNQYKQALDAYQQAQETLQNNPFASFENGVNANNVEEFCSIAQRLGENVPASIGFGALAGCCIDSLAFFGSDGLKQQYCLDNINTLLKSFNRIFLTQQGVILHYIGQLHFKQEDYSQALAYYQQALPILHEAKVVMEGATLTALGIIYRLQGKYDQALECSQHGLEISQTFNNRINEEDILYYLAIIYWAKGDISLALDTLSQKAEVENETFALNLAIGSEERKRAYIAGQDRSIDTTVTFHLEAVPQNTEASRLAFATVLQRKGRILDAVSDNIQRLRQNLQAEDQTLFDELSSFRNSLADLFYHKQNTLSAEEFKTQVAIFKTKIEELEDTLAQRSIEFRTLVQPVTVEAVQALIPVDAALVEFVRYFPFNPKTSSTSEAWGTPRYAAAILTHQENPKWIDLGETTPIDRAVKEFRDKLRNRQNQLSDLQESLQALHNLLIPRIQTELGDIRHLLIAPDSQLNLIPFAALVDSQNQYLGDIYTISYLTSGRDLLRSQVEGSDRPIQQDAVIIANSDLHGMDIETKAIASFLQNVLLLKDSQAIKETLKQYSPTILHIAAHGFFSRSTDNPVLNENPLLRCGLILAGDNTDQRDNEKVVLTALEVTGLNLRGTRLVVLSACETGLGGVLDGEGVYGLRRAFVIAGAQSQMVSLWNVDDLPTTFLIINFYDRLSHQHSYPNLEAGSVAIALNQAQLWLKNLTKGNLEKWIEEKQLPLDPTMRMNLRRRLYKLEDDAKPFKSPFYWAAFCAISQ